MESDGSDPRPPGIPDLPGIGDHWHPRPRPDLPGTGMDPRPRVVSGIPRPGRAESSMAGGRVAWARGPERESGSPKFCELANCQCTYYLLSGYKYQTKEGPLCNLVVHASSGSLMVGPSWSNPTVPAVVTVYFAKSQCPTKQSQQAPSQVA